MNISTQLLPLLTHFGISQQAADIYITILSQQDPSVTEIARTSKLNRTAIYFHLQHLLEKDLVREIKQGKIKHYRATPPTDLAGRLQRWSTDFKSLVPELESLYLIKANTPEITVKQFKEGYFEYYSELAALPVGEEFRVIQGKTSADIELDILTQDQWKWLFQQMVDRNIMTRAIFTEGIITTAKEKMTSEVYAIFKQRHWQLRMVNEERFPFQEVMIYGNKVSFLLTDIGYIMTIHHKEIAQSMISIFDALWLTGIPKKFV